MVPREHTPWFRYVWAITLGGSLLAMTYVLFDGDLGTPVPLFQEFTCRGNLIVTATDGHGRAALRTPESAIIAEAFDEDNRSQDVYFVLNRREGDRGAWSTALAARNPVGHFVFTLSDVAPSTRVYVAARHIDGEICEGRSAVLASDAGEAGARR